MDTEKQKKIDSIWGTTPVSNSSEKVAKNRADELRERARLSKQTGDTGLKGFATGVGKGIVSTLKGAAQLGEQVGGGILGGVEKVTGLPVKPTESVYSEEALKADAENGGAIGKLLREENLEGKTPSEKTGKFAEQVAEFVIPGSKVAKATEGANLLTKAATRGLTSGAIGATQSGEIGTEAALAGGIDAALPVAGTLGKNLLGRLFKGLGGGLSGTPTNLIDDLAKNPKLAKNSIKELEKLGAADLAEKNARTILNGVSTVKQNARKAFGEGLEQLAETDIKPKVFKDTIKPTLDKFGSVIEKGKRVLQNVEFDDPKNISKASELIDRLSNTKLDGKSLRKLADDISASAYKTATSDERLAYNAFIKDLSATLKKAVSNSTDKLDEINKSFSTDMQLAELMEDYFGKVNFKNLSEVSEATKKLESLFNKKEFDIKKIDEFLSKIGATDLKTSEAVRQISSKVSGSNTKGLGLGELVQQVTSAVVTPKTVRNVAIFTGLAEPVVKSVLEKLSPTARGIFIKSFISED